MNLLYFAFQKFPQLAHFGNRKSTSPVPSVKQQKQKTFLPTI